MNLHTCSCFHSVRKKQQLFIADSCGTSQDYLLLFCTLILSQFTKCMLKPQSMTCNMSGLIFLIFLIPFTTATTANPNIVIIVADDLGYNDVSWHNPVVKTPHLEKLARDGVLLEQHYSQPICTPTRAALLSGR